MTFDKGGLQKGAVSKHPTADGHQRHVYWETGRPSTWKTVFGMLTLPVPPSPTRTSLKVATAGVADASAMAAVLCCGGVLWYGVSFAQLTVAAQRLVAKRESGMRVCRKDNNVRGGLYVGRERQYGERSAVGQGFAMTLLAAGGESRKVASWHCTGALFRQRVGGHRQRQAVPTAQRELINQ
jgi:hypothetical protein